MEQINALLRMKNRYSQLSAKQKKSVDYILKHTEKVTHMTMRELSEKCETSEATLVRLLQKLGYSSFQEFRIDVAKECSRRSFIALETKLGDGYQDIVPGDSMEGIKEKVIQAATEAIRETQNLVSASQLQKAATVLENAKQILCYGSGGSLVLAQDIYHKFLRLDLPVFCDANLHFTLVRAHALSRGDVVILISHTGESRDMLECARKAKQQGATVIGLTSYLDSSLAHMADLVFYSSNTALEYYTDAMTSRLTQMTILDMIYLKVRLDLGDAGVEKIARAKEAIVDLKRPKRT